MKKLVCLVLTLIILSVTLVGCSSTITPISTPCWTDGETLSYNVRKASDYELSLVSIDQSNIQIMPKSLTGTYSTSVSLDGENYRVDSILNVTETYATADFGTDNELLQLAKEKANQKTDDALSFDGTDFIVNVKVTSSCTFNKTSFLPTKSSKHIQSAVFIRSSIVNGKTYEGQCQVNDISYETTYDYSAKSPKATVTSNILTEQTTVKLQKSSSGKTYDNEQLVFLLRSFSLDTLKSNLTTPLTIFDGAQTLALALSVTVTSTPSFDYQIGGTLKGVDNDGKQVYYQTEDSTQYTDVDGNVVETTQRSVSQIYLVTGGKPIYYYYDNQNSDSPTDKNTLIRMQQGYMIFDIDKDSLATL